MRTKKNITPEIHGFEILSENKINEKYTFASILAKNIPPPNAEVIIPLIYDNIITTYSLLTKTPHKPEKISIASIYSEFTKTTVLIHNNKTIFKALNNLFIDDYNNFRKLRYILEGFYKSLQISKFFINPLNFAYKYPLRQPICT